MKALYILSFLSIPLVSFSQDFSYPIGQHIVAEVQEENFESYGIDINTPSAEPIQYKYELISNTFPSTWSYSLCDYGNCYVGVPANGTMSAISQSESENNVIGWFKLNLTVGQNYGQGTVKLYLYDSNDYNRGDTVSWNISWPEPSTSIQENKLNAIALSPNPANEYFSLLVEGEYRGTIINSIGEEVKLISGTKLTQHSISDLKTGVYFVTISTQFGVITKRLIVK